MAIHSTPSITPERRPPPPASTVPSDVQPIHLSIDILLPSTEFHAPAVILEVPSPSRPLCQRCQLAIFRPSNDGNLKEGCMKHLLVIAVACCASLCASIRAQTNIIWPNDECAFATPISGSGAFGFDTGS